MKKDILTEKSFAFAVKVLHLTEALREKKEYIVSAQIGKSGTSIGANIRESKFAQGKKDFVSKLEIASKEASETCYWLELLLAAGYISKPTFDDLYNDCNELLAILSASCCTAKENIKNNT
ncbi:MAG: four helix bundle protein [Clostridia bacterium]|nr:four helix bundle protein [Clostridia bacterium]MBR6777480.1 four helix bundle protein [Clostridia bacterium]